MTTQTNEWKDIIKERMDNYNNEVSKITRSLNKVINELKTAPYGIKAESNRIENGEKLTWEVNIGKHSHLFYLNDFKLGPHPSGRIIESLEERIEIAILEKFKFELK